MMSYPDLLRDQRKTPIPQGWDGSNWRALRVNEHGQQLVQLVDASGNPISSDNKVPVAASDLEALIGALDSAAVADPTQQASVIAGLKGLLTLIGATDAAVVDAGAAGNVSAKLRRVTADLGALLTRIGATDASAQTDPTQAASEIALLKGLLTLVGALNAAAVTDPAQNGSLIALLKGLLTRLNTLAGTVDSGAQKVTLSGQIKGIAANRPDADSVEVGTVYWSVDTGDVSVSTGTEWRSLGVA